MSELDADSFRFSQSGSVPKPRVSRSSLLEKFQAESFRFSNTTLPEKENADPNLNKKGTATKTHFSSSSPLNKYDPGSEVVLKSSPLDKFESFKEELWEIFKGTNQATPPQVFIKGRHVGGAEEVMRMVDQVFSMLQGRVSNRGHDRVFSYFEFTVIATVAGVITTVMNAIAAVASNSEDDKTTISRSKSRSRTIF
ncbi:uncharacterized protein LOC120159213 [Hibiscus syriacus]|nr:uncharacterized protein LOC120159213 [Hibiscus syriacus]